MIVSNIVQQHIDDAVALANLRASSTRAAYANLSRLRLADDRLLAHLEGIALAGDAALPLGDALLEHLSPGAVFTLAIGALERKEDSRLERLIAVTAALPELVPGLLAAFGWVDRSSLQGIVVRLLAAPDPFRRLVGLACCAMHRVDPGHATARLLQDADGVVRARAFRTAGELGLQDMLSPCVAVARSDGDDAVQFWAAWSAVLLGDRGAALDLLAARAFQPVPHRERAVRLALQAMTPTAVHATLQKLAADRTNLRLVIQGSGIAGDPTYAPWLIKQMDEPRLARLAAEAFTLIAGLDLGQEAMDRPAPPGFEAGPTEDPADPDVDMDPDDDLAWPDADAVKRWWDQNGRRFEGGRRYFLGATVTRAWCLEVLRTGYQRQRILAGHYLCLLDPGTPLFNTSAPAWRQQRLLAQMS